MLPWKILVVDDDPDIRRIAALSLERIGGFRVELAAGGDEALGLMARELPDVVLLDVTMPGRDGPATLLALREIPGAEHLPVDVYKRQPPRRTASPPPPGLPGRTGEPLRRHSTWR